VPYLGPAQTDLVFAYDGNDKFDDNGLINMFRSRCVLHYNSRCGLTDWNDW